MAKEGSWTIAQVHERKFWENWIANYKKEHPDDDAWQGDRKGGALQWTHDANLLLRILENQGKQLTEGSRILEIGGGLVGHSRWFPKGHLFAVDPLQDFFEAAFSELGPAGQQVRQDVTYIGHKAEELAHNLEPLDLILIINCLDHCDRPAEAVANMAHLLKPDGLLFEATTVWPRGYLHGQTRSEMVKTHPYIFEGNELLDLFEAFGFELIPEPLVKEWMVGAWPRELRLWKIRRPKVSILLPTYRRPQLIKRALSSIYGQDFKDWELIVVENGSTREIQEQYFEEVVSNLPKEYQITWLTVPWASLPDALNLGLERATGKYIAIQEDDDEWMARFLSALTSHMDNCTCGMAYVRQIEVEDGKPIRRFASMPDHFDRGQLFAGNYISLPTAMVRREALEAIGGFHPDAGPATDWITWCLISRDWPACYLDEALLIHHWHKDENAPNYCLVEPGNTRSSIRYTLLQRKMLARGDFGPWPAKQKKR